MKRYTGSPRVGIWIGSAAYYGNRAYNRIADNDCVCTKRGEDRGVIFHTCVLCMNVSVVC